MKSLYSMNHAHITGEFGEHLVLYWLSKNGYESVHAQYVGIDIIASKNNKRIGISVKSRSRKEGKADYSLTITKPILQIDKVKATCSQFACEPYFAFVIDQLDLIKVVVTPLAVIEGCYTNSNKSSQDWNILKFAKDNRSSVFEMKWS
jgi:Holliday junction resolvase-like predicted endonuclease